MFAARDDSQRTANRRWKQQEARREKQEQAFDPVAYAYEAFPVCKSSPPTILFSPSTLTYKARRPARQNFSPRQNLRLTSAVKRVRWNCFTRNSGIILVRSRRIDVEVGEGGRKKCNTAELDLYHFEFSIRYLPLSHRLFYDEGGKLQKMNWIFRTAEQCSSQQVVLRGVLQSCVDLLSTNTVWFLIIWVVYLYQRYSIVYFMMERDDKKWIQFLKWSTILFDKLCMFLLQWNRWSMNFNYQLFELSICIYTIVYFIMERDYKNNF